MTIMGKEQKKKKKKGSCYRNGPQDFFLSLLSFGFTRVFSRGRAGGGGGRKRRIKGITIGKEKEKAKNEMLDARPEKKGAAATLYLSFVRIFSYLLPANYDIGG